MALSRRKFLQKSAIGAASVTLGASGVEVLQAATTKKLAWSNGMQINPEISNTRIICCHDENMVDSDGAGAATFSKKNSFVNTDAVHSNMDQMAMKLTEKENASAAWQTVFMKPSGKEWDAVKVAIKVNCIYSNMMPQVAIVGKVCEVLIERGVSASNITIYDACHNAYGNGKYNTFLGNGIPEGVVVSNVTRQGEKVDVGSGQQTCAVVVLEADILVNCAINKGHGQNKGGFTLTMKNHTGTMKFSCPSVQEMIDQNKSEAILGSGSPSKQQLCIVDCLWSAKPGPFADQTHFTNRIVMGTMGPLVDVAVARNIREPLMDASHNNTAIEDIVSGFGYAESDIQWVEFSPDASIASEKFTGKKPGKRLKITARNSSQSIECSLPATAKSVQVTIADLHGRTLKCLNVEPAKTGQIVWDGKDEIGRRVGAGRYAVVISAETRKIARRMLSLY